MLSQLSKNQYVKISNCHKNEDTEYGIVLTCLLYTSDAADDNRLV